MESVVYDLIVVGAGAAGMMAAGVAASRGLQVALLDSNEKCGKKVYITGKGRCNITNDVDAQDFLNFVVSNPKFIYSAIHNFTPYDTMDFFESRGLSLEIQRGGRVFPCSNKASDVTSVLTKEAKRNGVAIFLQQKVETIIVHPKDTQARFLVRAKDHFYGNNVLLATGGLSYPSTGSDGSGYQLAKNLGHTIIQPKSALVALEFEQNVTSLMGLSLRNIGLTITYQNKPIHQLFGELVFTNKGASGPIMLSTSSLINRLDLQQVKLSFDLKPALSQEKLDERILRDWDKQKNKVFANSLDDLLPQKIIPYIVQNTPIQPYTRVHSITKQQRNHLVQLLKNLVFTPSRLGDIAVGIVTAGGVDTRQIDPKTMQSKLIQGLYFAGEIIDIDAVTGGYNIQMSFSTGNLAGKKVEKYSTLAPQ